MSSLRKKPSPAGRLLLALALFAPLAGCGTLMFPERRGQEDDEKLDPNILLLDGLLLVFYIVPGVVAYAIDYGTNALWLPNDKPKGEGPFWGEGELFDKSAD